MLFKFKIQLGLLLLMTLAISCSDIENIGVEPSNDNIINVGGVETGEMTVTTRANAVDAETKDWLVQPLESGLDITYGLYGVSHAESNEDVAILKLTDKTTTPATYSFNYRQGNKHNTGTEKAIWHNNGYHYFQGVHVPNRIRYNENKSEVDGKASGLTTDQHNDNATGDDNQLGNYTLLSHYLGMPANYRLMATVERIKLPFRHRLARVVAFVLIDPELNTTLKGYKKKVGEQYETETDPTNVSIRFCNVRVLEGVKDVAGTDGHHILTPTWGRPRKVIPHFEGEKGSYSYKTGTPLDDNFKMYVGTSDAGKAVELYPTSNGWQAAHDDSDHKRYKEINYGKVPVYDLIVRPTYSSWENVMYDEAGYDPDSESKLRELANVSNSIDFEIELENGLRYEKTFDFDLNANYQTVVYLRISREKVDYDDAGSEIWIEEKNYDGWYGTDNENGNTLSYAGSSWQRAYTYGEDVKHQGEENHTDQNSSSGVTDGHFYNASSSEEEREKAQYFTEYYKDIWVKKFAQAYKGGAHHGDYFILTDHITIDAGDLPADFVFTGHLDAQDKTITLTGTNEWKVSTIDPLSKLKAKTGSAGTDEDYTDVPKLYWVKQIAQSKAGGVTEIPAGEPIELDTTKTTPADITSDMLLFYKDSEGKFQLYTNRTFYKKTGASLFAGLKGDYTTAQESNSSLPADQWEANVHKETNKSTVWVPTHGYRAEVLNLQIAVGATLFKPEAVVTGNVQNCYNLTTEGKEAVTNTPNIPQYK